MRSFQAIGGYFSAAKNKITATIQTIWQKDYVQATYQGLFAPIYSRASFQSLVSASQGLQTSLSRTVTENGTYALRALILYFVYYRMVHPTLQKYQDALDDNSWIGSPIQNGLHGIDISLYMAMICYLMTYGWQNSAQNLLLTSAITTTAGNAMKPSSDFKPCDQKECGTVTMARAGLDSGFFYLANRYIVNKASWSITNSMPGVEGKILAFALEAVSIGLPLVEYKFSAVGQCTMHKYKEMLSSYKTYCIMYGASFVTVTWSSYKLLSSISGESNPYIYDAVFSLVFQMYVILAIARETKFPGNDKVNIDIMKWLKWIAEKPLTHRLLKGLLGPLSSFEEFVQSPGAGIAISVYDKEIKRGINSAKGGIQQLRDFQNNRIVTTLRWVNTWFPYQFIPDGVTTACKSVSKTALSRIIRRIDYLLELGRDAEIQRNAQPTTPNQFIVETRDNHFGSSPQEDKKIDETTSLAMLQVTEPYFPRFKTGLLTEEVKPELSHIECKSEIPKEDKQIEPVVATKDLSPEQKFDAILQANVVNVCYFGNDKDREFKKVQSPLNVSQKSATLFAKKEGNIFHGGHQNMSRKQDSLASVTAAIISRTGKARALR